MRNPDASQSEPERKLKAVKRADLAFWLGISSVVCTCFTGLPALILGLKALADLPKTSEYSSARNKALVGVCIFPIVFALLMVMVVVAGIGASVSPSTRPSTSESAPADERDPRRMKLGQVMWNDVREGADYSVQRKTYSFSQPGLDSDANPKYVLEAGEPLTVLEKRIIDDPELTQILKRQARAYWIKATVVKLRKDKRGNLEAEDLEVWIEEPSLKQIGK